MLFIFIILSIFVFFGLHHIAEFTKSKLLSETFSVLAVCSSFIAFILGVVLICSYPISLDTIANMENFYDRNYSIMKIASEDYTNAVTVKTSENTVTTVTIPKDFIDQITKYNHNLTWYHKYQKHWFYNAFVSKVSDRLGYLELPRLSQSEAKLIWEKPTS